MCFILNLLNSCSFKSKPKSSNKNTSINKPDQVVNNTSSCSQSSCSGSEVNEKTSLKKNTIDAKSSLETAERLKEKFFKTKLIYSKLESPIEHEQQKINKIIDYCNDCGYYSCECDKNKTNFDDKHLSLYFTLNNSFVNKLVDDQDDYYSPNLIGEKYKTVFCQNSSSPSSLKTMKSNNNKIDINISNKSNDFNLMLSSQSSLSSTSSNATIRSPNTNPFLMNMESLSSNDIEMKEDFNSTPTHFTQQNHIPFEKPALNLFPNRFSNNDMDMPFLSPKMMKRPLLGHNLNKQPELKLDYLQTKKQQFVFNAEQLLFAKPIEPEDKELSDILDNELNSSRSEMNEEDSPVVSCRSGVYERSHHSSSSSSNKKHRRRHRDGKIIISKEQVYEFKESELKDLGQIGYGEFGTVHKVLHTPSQTCMALKRIRPTVGSQGERKKVLKELDFVLECHDCTHVVKFYGVKLNNEPAENLICMELMDSSLEKLYKFVYEKKLEEIPELILGKIVVATVSALNYLKESHKIIHRDVKPSNILINKQGEIKMCDFGISGKLVDSIAASRDAGCQLYMAPERIDPRSCTQGYDVRSDVWSLGITLYELATGKFPYPQWKTIFHQLNLVVDSDAPRLEVERLSRDFRDFVNTCLTKDERKRPKYKELLQHPLIQTHINSNVIVSDYVTPYIEQMQQNC